MALLIIVLQLSPTHKHTHPPSQFSPLTCPHVSTPVHTQVRTSRWPYRPHGSQRRGPGPSDASRAQVRGVAGQAGDHTTGVKGGGEGDKCGIRGPRIAILWWWCHMLSPLALQEKLLGSALRCGVATCSGTRTQVVALTVVNCCSPPLALQEELLGSALRWLPPPPEKEARNSKGREMGRQKGGRGGRGRGEAHNCILATSLCSSLGL